VTNIKQVGTRLLVNYTQLCTEISVSATVPRFWAPLIWISWAQFMKNLTIILRQIASYEHLTINLRKVVRFFVNWAPGM